MSLADPFNISCSSDVFFSETHPDQIFSMNGPGLCFPEHYCTNIDPNGPCVILLNAHANFYYETVDLPLHYEITTNQNNILSLRITNNNSDVAYYESEPILAVEDFNTTALNIYPNPVTGQLFVGKIATPVHGISIFSLEGKLLLSSKNTQKIDMASLPSGLYLVQIVVDGKINIQKVLKK